jgi:hypothetical protein
LGVWVAFLKQPNLPGAYPKQTKNSKKFKKIKIINKKSQMNQKYFKDIFFSFWGALHCFKKATQTPNAGHPIFMNFCSVAVSEYLQI